ncbi:MAG TPA: DMT family transporter [Gammaproteobacteria bacterium]|jgi:drug/metabolite transporter (DMT)-like permease
MIDLSERHRGMAFALLTACGLGAITTQAKLFYADGGNALTLMLARFIASVVVFGLLLAVGRRGFGIEPRLRLPLLALGLVWPGATICYLLAVETISVSLAVLIFYFYPLLVLVYALLRRQLAASPALLGLFLGAFLGLYLALAGGAITFNTIGGGFAVLASVGAAFTFVCGARVAPAMSPLLMTFWINAAGLLLILPLMPGSFSLPAAGGWLAAGLATLLYLVAILSQFQALARLPAARAAFLLNLEPVVSILLAGIVLGEVLTPTQWIGVVLVVSMIVLSLRFRPADA